MTSYTKHFIELSDLVGIQLECANPKCGVSLLVNGDTFFSLADPNNTTLVKCPTCLSSWAVPDLYPQRGYDTQIKEFIRQLGEMRKVEEKIGCKLRFELKDEASPAR